MSDNIRKQIIEKAKEEIFGPTDKDSKEVLLESPLKRYFSGVLYPRETREDTQDEQNEEPIESGTEEPLSDNKPTKENEIIRQKFIDLTDDEEDYLSLSNAFYQSAVSLTVFLRKDDIVTIDVSGAVYKAEKAIKEYQTRNKDGELETKEKKAQEYHRIPVKKDSLELTVDQLTKFETITICQKPKIILAVYPRWVRKEGKAFTFSLVNNSKKPMILGYDLCFFQANICLRSKLGFLPIPQMINAEKHLDADGKNNALLYRKIQKYAIGHGCAPEWGKSTPVKQIQSSFVPVYELTSIVPRNALMNSEHPLSMENFYKQDKNKTLGDLRVLCNEYDGWIAELESEINSESFEKKYTEQAKRNILECKICLERMEDGIDCLEKNDNAFLAFQLMNKAMLLQQLHSKQPLLHFTFEKGKKAYIKSFREIDLEEKNTWPEELSKLGKWRAFQIAFVLINIHSIIDEKYKDRENVDLIWFPTGGGKTEAYLGLTGFTLLYNRIIKKDKSDCCQVIMRYTLRLLTSQQYQRAASLICACEKMRREETQLLGESPITIGLWVGGSTTPNTIKGAFQSYDNFNNNKGTYDFVITKCPWCGAEMGPAHYNKKECMGLARESAHGQKVVFNCSNPDCEFHDGSLIKKPTKYLPLRIVDEEIYENPTSLLIGTVDKFALIPLINRDVRNIFGLKDGMKTGRSHPSIIIQDELHLISGPLGSTVGAYETMIDYLCSVEEGEDHKINFIRPKIVASTATIARAKEQCHHLYNVPESKVKIFPPSGLDNGETYFSMNKPDIPGRKYVGLFMPGAKAATAVIHLMGALYVAKNQIDYQGNVSAKDAYWTNMCYYNSMRELARAATWVQSDINENARIVLRRQGKDNEAKQLPLPIFNELNSRNSSSEITECFDELKVKYSSVPSANKAVDYCLATNMISVGLDVDRLGLMTIMGQPKTTAEYIQASSRVGRSSNPGLVFTIYGTTKPRDKSIFEDFQNYHSKFYSFVESTSVSPFCTELRQRVMPALIVGMTRCVCSKDEYDNPMFFYLAQQYKTEVTDYILARVLDIDKNELDDTKLQIESIYSSWNKNRVHKENYPFRLETYMAKEDVSAIYPNTFKLELDQDKWKYSYSAPTSMRDVDTTCRLEITDKYL